ncbi:MAG: carboxymuconolactone decarboxylase family protein [Halioglobus sp.]
MKLISQNGKTQLLAAVFCAAVIFSSFANSQDLGENTMVESDDKTSKGMAVVEALFPDAATSLSMPDRFRRYTLDHLFGDVWQGDELTLHQRSMITCVTIVALNRENEMRLHFRGAKNIGIERKTLEAAIIHVAHYAGWPTAISAFSVLNEVWPEEESTSE